MMLSEGEDLGSVFPVPFVRSVDDDGLRRNLLHALSLGLQQVRRAAPNNLVLAIAAGGPSLRDTYKKLRNPGPNTVVVSVNGSHDWLIGKGVVPYACLLLDPAPRLAELFTPHRGVVYFVASTCDRAVFDKLNGFEVRLVHASGQVSDEVEILDKRVGSYFLIGGGSTVSLRWLTLGYIMGFRSFRLHGFDSCSKGGSRHAYAQDDGDLPDEIEYHGFSTTPAWLAQVTDFFGFLAKMSEPGMDRISLKVYGDGLLQSEWKRFRKECGNLFK